MGAEEVREIKFRAINKNTGEIKLPDSLTFENGEWFGSYRDYEDGTRLDLEKWAVVQFTGLRDKNGVEIYEGDVMKIGEKIYYVDNVEYGFTFMENKNSGHPFINFLSRDKKTDIYTPIEEVFEVIGNVYQHSHLLEESK